jgi:hypothetical protein
MAKKKKEEKEPQVGDVIRDKTGWKFRIEGSSVYGHKTFEPGVNREVDGTTLENARANAAEIDRMVDLRQKGIAEQNQTIADALHAEADKVANRT